MQYNVLSNLKHNGFRYVHGALIDLEDDVAAKLVEDGVIEPFTGRPEPQPVKATNEPKPTDENPKKAAAPETAKSKKAAAPKVDDNGDDADDL